MRIQDIVGIAIATSIMALPASADEDIAKTQSIVQDIVEALPEQDTSVPNPDGTGDYRPLNGDDITTGLITDYLQVFDLIKARTAYKNYRSVMDPLGGAYTDIVYHVQGRGAYDGKNGWASVAPRAYCPQECKRLLIEGHVQRVTVVSYSPDTYEAMPDPIVYTKAASCAHMKAKDDYNGLAALGLCLTSAPGDVPASALHLYHNMASPLWPDAYEFDQRAVLSDTLMAVSVTGRVLAGLEHVRIHLGQNPVHRAAAISRNGVFEAPTILTEAICLRVSPRLPRPAMRLIYERHGGDIDNEIYTDDLDGLCYGDQDAKYDGIFGSQNNNRRYNMPQIMSAEAIAASLEAWVTAGRDPVISAKAMAWLQVNDPRFQDEIAPLIAPILVKAAARTPQINFDTLSKMPRGSMTPHIEGLKAIYDAHSKRHNCTGFYCAEDNDFSRQPIKDIPKIFNGAGAAGAGYLDTVFQRGFVVELTRDGPRYERIQGYEDASVCAGKVGDAIAKSMRIDGSPSAGGLKRLSWLRLSNRKAEAAKTLDWYIRRYTADAADERASQRTRKEAETMLNAATTLQLNWDDAEPYCKARLSIQKLM